MLSLSLVAGKSPFDGPLSLTEIVNFPISLVSLIPSVFDKIPICKLSFSPNLFSEAFLKLVALLGKYSLFFCTPSACIGIGGLKKPSGKLFRNISRAQRFTLGPIRGAHDLTTSYERTIWDFFSRCASHVLSFNISKCLAYTDLIFDKYSFLVSRLLRFRRASWQQTL